MFNMFSSCRVLFSQSDTLLLQGISKFMTTHSSLHLPCRLEVLVAADFAEVLLANKFSRLLLLSPEDDSVFSLSATRVKSVIPF